MLVIDYALLHLQVGLKGIVESNITWMEQSRSSGNIIKLFRGSVR